MKTVGWLYWDARSENKSATDPASIWTVPMWKQMAYNDIRSVWLDPSTNPDGLQYAKLEECDILFCYWRWELPNIDRYRTRNEAYAFQMKTLQEAFLLNIPVIVYDCDMMITIEQRFWLLSCGASIRIPAFFPYEGAKTLHYPMVYKIGERGEHKRVGISYVGNNYGRYDMARRYLNWPNGNCNEGQLRLPLVEDPGFTIYGNWMDRSQFRESPEQVRSDFPNAKFPGLLDQNLTVDVLRKAKATVHIAKPEYANIGFIALRWFEAVAAGTPAFIPEEWNLPIEIPKAIDAYGISMDVQFNPNILDTLLMKQRELVEPMSFDPWIAMFKRELNR